MQPNPYWTQTSQYPFAYQQQQIAYDQPRPYAPSGQPQPYAQDPQQYYNFAAAYAPYYQQQQQYIATQWAAFQQQQQNSVAHRQPAQFYRPTPTTATPVVRESAQPKLSKKARKRARAAATLAAAAAASSPAVASTSSQGSAPAPAVSAVSKPQSRPPSPLRPSSVPQSAPSVSAPSPAQSRTCLTAADPALTASETKRSPAPGSAPVEASQASVTPASVRPTRSARPDTPPPRQAPARPPSPEVPTANASFSAQLAQLDMANDINVMINDIGAMKVDQLKLTLRNCNEQFSERLRLNGLKADLYARCRNFVYQLAAEPDKTRFNLLKRIISDARVSSGSGYSPSSAGSYGHYPAPPPAPAPRYNPPPHYNPPPIKQPLPPPRFGGYGQGPAASGSGTGAYGGYNPNGQALQGQPSAATQDVPLLFRSNPFYKVERSLCSVVTLPKAGQGDRKSVGCNFALTEPQRTALAKSKASPSNPQFQVRLYCTNEDYFNPHRPSDRQTPAPIDFPTTCEIKLNQYNVPANTKGIKKQVGTASPVDLAKGGKLDITPGAINKLEVIYVNTEKVNSRRYFMVVYLVEVTTVKELADRVKTGKQRSKEEVIQSVIKMNSDPDMEASSFGVSLKDPLTLARIKIPIRSSACTHISCFDAEVWFMMNEQTPTWTCPICSKVLRVEDLVHDNFFADVLKTIGSAEVDAITIEPDGTWRSDNDKFGTAQPKSTAPSRAASVKPDISGFGNASGEGSAAPEGKGKGKAATVTEALTLDSDDDEDDQPLAKRQRLNGLAGGYGGTISIDSSPAPGAFRPSSATGGAAPAQRRMDTIDLTLSDSDDDGPSAAAAAPAPHLSAYVPPPIPRPGSAASSSNGAGGQSQGQGAQGDSEALRRRLAQQAQLRQVEDLRRRREEEARANGNGQAGRWGDDW